MCGCCRVELIEQHETSTMTGGSLLLCGEEGRAPREVGTNGFHWIVGQSDPCYFHCINFTVDL